MTRLLLFTTVILMSPSLQSGLLIVDNQRSTYKIIIPAKPTSQEIRAAELLQKYILGTANCKLPIVNSDNITSEDVILIKSSPLITDPDGFMIQTIGNQFFITGGSLKGCIYGVIDLLEKHFGCRKYSVNYEVVPKTDMVYLPDLNYRDAPVNQVRIINGAFCKDEDYRDWQRLNTIDELFPQGYYVHTFHRLIPWESYFEEHPDYFALMNGKRIIVQPCLSNPDVLKIVLNTLGSEMILQPDKKIWSVSQNDNFSYCQCDACNKIIWEEGSPAGPIIRFVNEVAKKFPDKTISTLAYQYSIYLWDYTVNFNHHVNPFPNLHVLQSNIQLFSENNIHEHFQQSNTGNGHEFSELKSYLISRLLWDPNTNADSVLTEFLNGYYGPAAPLINEYIHHLSNEMAKSEERLDIYEHPTAHQNSVLSLRNVNEYNHMFDQAEEAEVQNLNEAWLTPQEYYDATKRFIDVQVKGNLAFRKKVTSTPLPAEKYSGGDLSVLTNGVFGANDFKAHWLGWEGENFSLNLDLGQVQTVDTIQISTLWEQKIWIFHPAAVACYVSENGTDYRLIGEQHVEGDQWEEEVTRTFLFTLPESGIRFIRHQVSGLLKNPDWHPSAGGTCWVFVDEVVVR